MSRPIPPYDAEIQRLEKQLRDQEDERRQMQKEIERLKQALEQAYDMGRRND